MSLILLKTTRRKTIVSRLAVRKAVAATFVPGTFMLKKTTAKSIIESPSVKL
jgi:hypothetical protein